MSGCFHIVGWEEVLRHEGDATRPSSKQEHTLPPVRYETTSATTILRIGPLPDLYFGKANHLRHSREAATKGYDRACRFHVALLR